MSADDVKQGSWLPNLVGGVSIWKLAPDLNEPQFFDGRLLVPETEGSDSLPARVEWDLTGLIPLPEARATHPARVEKAVEEFFACLERTARVFEDSGSGFDRYKEAFTVPALSADGGAHYFFDPADDSLKVINWGASPREVQHDSEYLFGYQEFRDLIRQEQEVGDRGEAPAGAPAAASAAAGGAGLGAALRDDGADGAAGAGSPGAGGEGAGGEGASGDGDGEEDDEEEAAEGGRPWWMWALIVVAVLFVAALAFALLRDCDGAAGGAGADGAVPGSAAEAGAAGLDGGLAEEPIYGEASDDGGIPPTDLGEAGAAISDGGASGAEGSGGEGEAGEGGEGEAGEGGEGEGGEGEGGEGGEGEGGEGEAGEGGEGSGEAGEGGEGSGEAGEGSEGSGEGALAPPTDEEGEPIYGEYYDPGGGYYYWAPGYGRPLPSRSYFHGDAVQWRIVSGTGRVRDYSRGGGDTFRVYLQPGQSFEGVRVQWRDRSGQWHDH